MMSNIIPQLKLAYFEKESVYNAQKITYLQRIGKQFIDTILNIELVKIDKSYNKKIIANSIKLLQQQLINKYSFPDTKILYRMFGYHLFINHSTIPDYFQIYSQIVGIFIPISEHQQMKQTLKTKQINFQPDKKQIQNDNLIHSKVQTINMQKTDFKIQSQDIQDKLAQQKFQKVSIFQKQFLEQKFLQKIKKYLLNLSLPQTQLTYIQHHLKFPKFQISNPYRNQFNFFVCTTRIYLPDKLISNNLSQKYIQAAYVSKNMQKAKKLACMVLLKTLYLKHPQFFEYFIHIKSKKDLSLPPLVQQKDIQERFLIENMDGYEVNIKKLVELYSFRKQSIQEKMQKISAKSQLTILLQQLPGRVISPKLQRKEIDQKKLVSVRIQYKTQEDILLNMTGKIYECKKLHENSKFAEEQAYMDVIIKLYQQNPDLYLKIQNLKKMKDIKEDIKKLPLLRLPRVYI